MIWNPKLEARTLMYVASKEMSHEDVIALGADPSKRQNYASRPDGIVEVDMDGNVIWEWNISDHLVQDYSSEHPNYGVVSEHPGKMDPNFAAGVGGDWIHINGFDYIEVLDQVVINNSTHSEFYVVDHAATFIPGDPDRSVELAAGDEGDFIFRWGNPCVYDSGECPRSINEGQGSVDGHTIRFAVLPRLAPRADAIYRIKVRGNKPGDFRVEVEATAGSLKSPVTELESTKVYRD